MAEVELAQFPVTARGGVGGGGSAKRTSERTRTSTIYQTNLCLDREVTNGVADAIWLGLVV